MTELKRPMIGGGCHEGDQDTSKYIPSFGRVRVWAGVGSPRGAERGRGRGSTELWYTLWVAHASFEPLTPPSPNIIIFPQPSLPPQQHINTQTTTAIHKNPLIVNIQISPQPQNISLSHWNLHHGANHSEICLNIELLDHQLQNLVRWNQEEIQLQSSRLWKVFLQIRAFTPARIEPQGREQYVSAMQCSLSSPWSAWWVDIVLRYNRSHQSMWLIHTPQTDTCLATRKRTTRPVERDWEFWRQGRDYGEIPMERLSMRDVLHTPQKQEIRGGWSVDPLNERTPKLLSTRERCRTLSKSWILPLHLPPPCLESIRYAPASSSIQADHKYTPK